MLLAVLSSVDTGCSGGNGAPSPSSDVTVGASGATSASAGDPSTAEGGGAASGGDPGSNAGTSGSGDDVGGAGNGASGAASGGATSGGAASGGAASGGIGGDGGTASSGTGGLGGAETSGIGTPDCFTEGDNVTSVVLVNECAGTLTYGGSDISGGDIAAGGYVCISAGTATEELPAKRYWGYIGENPGNERHTLAEFTFNTTFNDFDWYNISHVDAHNLTMAIEALGRPDCARLACEDSLLENCPEVGKLFDSEGRLISCYSPDRDDPMSGGAVL